MITAAERRVLDTIAEHLDRDAPDLAAMLTPGRPHRYRMTWLSWLAVHLLVLPWAAILFLVEPAVAGGLLAAPAVFGVLGWGRLRWRGRRRRRGATRPAR